MWVVLVLVVSAVSPSVPAARAQAVPDSAALVPTDRPALVMPGDTVLAYGFASDSVVRARCEGAVIRRVDVHCLDIFDPVPAGKFQSVYRGVNKLHVRTRATTVQSLMVVSSGQRWSADRINESERKLRNIEYIEPGAIRSRLVNDSVDVLVVTHDQWTTQPELFLERAGGRTFGSVGFTERNLLGLGLRVSVTYRDAPAGHSRRGELSGDGLFGSLLDGKIVTNTGRGGGAHEFYLRDPYHSLDDPHSWTVSWSRNTAEQQLFRNGSLAARFPSRFQRAQIEYGSGRRLADGLVRRFTLGFSLYDRKYGVTVPEPSVPIAYPGAEEELKLRWASARVTFWKPHWIQRRGVELFDPIEDFEVGSLVSMESGLVMRLLGSTADEGTARLRFEAGRETHHFGFGFAHGTLSTRIRGGPRETLTHFESRWIQQPSRNVAIVVAALGEAADRAPREVQSIVGGLNGLRAYPVQALSGTELWRFNAETRWLAARDVWSLVSVGGAVFVDAARAWGAGGDRAPWYHDAGFGLRLAFPHASLHEVARFDVAFPLSPLRDGKREAVLSFGSSQAF